MIRLFNCLIFLFALSYGQIPERDTLSASETEIEELLEGVTDESGESQIVDILESMWDDLLDLSNRPNVRIRSRVQLEKPFPEVRTPLGSPLKVYQRILCDFQENKVDGLSLRACIVTEKDAGERFSDLFAVGSLDLVIPAMNGRILVGDFAVESGKGLVFWRSSGIMKGGSVLDLGKPRETRVEPYRSTDENHFLRGVALEKDVGWTRLNVFFSDRRLNGSRNAEGTVTSLDTDGLFRTASELRSREVVREVALGGILSMTPFDGFAATVKGSRIRLGDPLSLSRYNAFHGTNADVVAADFMWKAGTITLSGEAAGDGNGSVAAGFSMLVEPMSTMSTVLAARMYPRSFNSLHGFAISEGGIVEGESGVYLGTSIRLSRALTISFFYDAYVFSNRFLFRSTGNDFMIRGRIRLNEWWEMSLQHRRQSKPVLLHATDKGLDNLRQGRVIQERYRLSILHSISQSLKWQARMEATVRFSETNATGAGCLVFQEIRWQVYPALRISFRIAAYETDNYDSRIYAYEPDVPGGFSNVPAWNNGFRTYLLTEWSLAHNMRISAKYSRSYGEESVSGEDGGLQRERITVQCDVAF